MAESGAGSPVKDGAVTPSVEEELPVLSVPVVEDRSPVCNAPRAFLTRGEQKPSLVSQIMYGEVG